MNSVIVLRNGLYEIAYKQGAYTLSKQGKEIGSFASQDRAIQVANQRYKVRGVWAAPTSN